MKKLSGFVTSAVLPMAFVVGCPSADENEDSADEEGTGSEGDGSEASGTDAGPGGTDDDADETGNPDDTGNPEDTGDPTGPTGCADPADAGARVAVDANIEGDTEWTCDNVYVLDGIIFVNGGTLTIEPGTTILGTDGSALVIDKDAQIDAQGQENAPIVFTSIQPEGERNRGDWGGLVLLGEAVINVEGGTSTAEGFEEATTYGGTNDAHNCGTLRYLRVEYAGFAISEGNELNGITFYACGTDTTVDHVQSHMGQDDGIEWFGGGFTATHLVVTGAADDSLDIDEGFNGCLQHLFIHQDPQIGDNGFEISNQGSVFTAEPRTAPQIANATFVGSGEGGDKSKGVTFKEGTFGGIFSSIFAQPTNEFLLMSHPDTQTAAEGDDLQLAGVLLGQAAVFEAASDDPETEENEGIAWTADDLETWFTEGEGNLADQDLMLPSATWGSPDIAAPAGSPAEGAGQTPGGCFEATTYAGAVEPGGEDWTAAAWINYTP